MRETPISCPVARAPALEIGSGYNTPGGQAPADNRSSALVVAIDTIPVTAFGATLDRNENLYVVISTPGNRLLLFFSPDQGNTWAKLLDSAPFAPIQQIEILAGNTVNSPLFIFYLTPEDAGELYLLRLFPATGEINQIPLATGPDTIDRFTVTIDKDSNYYLYCLYVNERRTGRNGNFTRSRDRGATWEPAQPFWNTYQPTLSFGSGSLLHCIWRYGIAGREIHHSTNPYYGAPGRWRWLSVLKSGYERCFFPAVAQADTFPPWRAPVWAVWTVARRDTEMLDLEFAVSTDGGARWKGPDTLGELFVDEWLPALLAGRWGVDLIYHAGGRGENDPTVLFWCGARTYLANTFSAPVIVSDRRVNTAVFGARPRIVPLRWRQPGLPGIFFSARDSNSARGVFFVRPLSRDEAGNPKRESVAPVSPVLAGATVLFDPTGRRVERGNPGPGVYFIPTSTGVKKVVRLR